VDLAAGRRFLDVGMDTIAGGDPLDIDVLEAFRAGGRAWVVTDDDDRPVGYAVAIEVDGCAHLQQVSVLVEHGGRGLGRRLVDQVEQWGREQSLRAMTLSTFVDVPWNGPLYAKLGFDAVPDDQLTPGLRAIRADEEAEGVVVAPRHFMTRPIARSDGETFPHRH
jgi:GNAT superfamily N-acetyltransferase